MFITEKPDATLVQADLILHVREKLKTRNVTRWSAEAWIERERPCRQRNLE
jgi:hypothetical protein